MCGNHRNIGTANVTRLQEDPGRRDYYLNKKDIIPEKTKKHLGEGSYNNDNKSYNFKKREISERNVEDVTNDTKKAVDEILENKKNAESPQLTPEEKNKIRKLLIDRALSERVLSGQVYNSKERKYTNYSEEDIENSQKKTLQLLAEALHVSPDKKAITKALKENDLEYSLTGPGFLKD